MSVELLRLTSASLPSSAKHTPQIHKPVVPNVGTFNSSIFSPLPKNDEFVLGHGSSQDTESRYPTSSPITIKARDTSSTDLLGISVQSSPISNHEETSSRSVQLTLLTTSSINTSTPGSVRVKISPNKLMEIPSPIPNRTKSSDNAAAQTPPRALGIPTSKLDKESYGGFQKKPNTRGKLAMKVLPQGVMCTGSATTLDESNTDDSIVAVLQNGDDHLLVKQRLAQQKQSNPRKQCMTVHPNVVRPNCNAVLQEVKPSLATETKSVQTETVTCKSPLFLDEGIQCVEEKLPLRTRGVQTSPCNYGHLKQHLGQSLMSESTLPTNTTTVSTQLTTDTVTLIASTAAAAAVAASASVHGNNTHTKSKEKCLNLQTHLKSAPTNVAPPGHNVTAQTDRHICDDNSRKEVVTEHETISPSHPHTTHSYTDVTVNSEKFEKTAIDDAFAVLRSASIAEQEVEHHCTSLEQPSTLADFTDAMILGKPVEEKMRIHQQINKLIEQHKDDDGLPDEPKQTMTQQERLKVETENKWRIKRQSPKKKPTSKNVKRRNQSDDVMKLRHYRHCSKLDHKPDAVCKPPVPVTRTEHDILMDQFHLNNRTKMIMPAAVPLGPPRQSNSYRTVVTKHVKSVSCQASPVSPVEIKKDQNVLKKPNTSSYSIKVLSPVNISSSSDATEPTVLQAGKPDVTVYDDFHNSFQQVLDINSQLTIMSDATTTTADHRTGDGITLEGENVSIRRDYHGTSFPPKSAERLSQNAECLTMSSSELDKKLQEILEEKALDWVQQELLARLVADTRHDLVGHTVNSCSTCTSDDAEFGLSTGGMQEIPVDNECVKKLVCEEVLDLIKGLLKDSAITKQQQQREMLHAQSNDDSLSESLSSHKHLSTPTVTPLSTPVNLQSTASSLDHVRMVTTPLPTPPQSPTPSAHLQTETCMTSEIVRIPTPKSSLDSSTGDEIDSLVGHTQPTESAILSSPNTTPPTIRSIHSPPESSEIVMVEEKEDKVVVEPVAKQPTEFTLTESSSSTSSPVVSETSTTTSDREISMGEYILAKPAVLQRLKQPDYSVSEGEAPISPGDAWWHSMHASKLRGELKEIRKGKSPVLEAFLDLKQFVTSEKDSDTDFSSDSLQQPKQLLSEGEVLNHDPYKKFLDKLDSSNSSVIVQEDENTLSEVTSFLTHDDQSSVTSPPHDRPTGRSKKDISPGEAIRNISVLVKPPQNEDDISVGEVARTSQMAGQVSRSSPGEIPPILRASETRDGIDVIRVSRWSDKLSTASDAQYLMEEFESTDTIVVSSQHSSSVNKQGSSSQQLLGHHSTRSSTDTYTHPSNQHRPPVELNRKSVTINIPTTAGFQGDTNESTSEATFSISEMSPESSENF